MLSYDICAICDLVLRIPGQSQIGGNTRTLIFGHYSARISFFSTWKRLHGRQLRTLSETVITLEAQRRILC